MPTARQKYRRSYTWPRMAVLTILRCDASDHASLRSRRNSRYTLTGSSCTEKRLALQPPRHLIRILRYFNNRFLHTGSTRAKSRRRSTWVFDTEVRIISSTSWHHTFRCFPCILSFKVKPTPNVISPPLILRAYAYFNTNLSPSRIAGTVFPYRLSSHQS